MSEILIIAGGIHMLTLVVFHLLFWRIFKWPETLSSLNKINKSTIQVLNISITFIFAIFAYISLAYTGDGQSKISPINPLDLADAIADLLEAEPRQIRSIGGPAEYTWNAKFLGARDD
jgi:hypothetical protein